MKEKGAKAHQHLVGQLIQIQAIQPHSSLKTVAMKNVIAWMKKQKFHSFSTNNGNGTAYPSVVGEYFEVENPPGKRGHLGRFAGKKTIVVCVGSGKYRSRKYMAGAIQE